MFQII
jgi:hypothetical protein